MADPLDFSDLIPSAAKAPQPAASPPAVRFDDLVPAQRWTEDNPTFAMGDPREVGPPTVMAPIAGAFERGAVRGATYGFNDELEAAVRAAAGENYDQALADVRARNAADMREHPIASATGMVAGGIGSALATRGVATRLAGPRLAAMAPSNAYVRLALGGAGAGGLAGFGESENGFLDRLGGAGTGAALGAAVGPIAGFGLGLINRLGGRLWSAFGGGDAGATADRLIIRSLDRDKVPLEEAGKRLTAAGDQPVAVVDVGGRNTVNLGATAANTPSEAMEAADKFVESRRLGRPDRLTAASDAAFGGGSGADVAEATAARQAQRQSEATPLYHEAFGKPAGMTDAMQHIIDDPIGQTGLKQGLEIQRIENAARRARGEPEVPTTDPAIRYDEDGTPRIVGVPNMRTLDAIKRGMDSIIDAARSETTGQVQWTERLRAIDDMRRTWVRLLDENNPAYAAARAAWAGPSAQMEATQAGRAAMKTDRDIVARRMEDAPDVQDAYRLGAGRGVADRFSDPARASGNARLLLENHDMQARLGSLLSPEELAAFNDALRRETAMTAVERQVGPRSGSQTKRLLAGGEDMADGAGPLLSTMNLALSEHPIRAVARDYLIRRLGQGINPTISDALANRLFVTDPAERAMIYSQLQNRLLTDQARAERARRIIGPVLQGVAQQAGAVTAR